MGIQTIAKRFCAAFFVGLVLQGCAPRDFNAAPVAKPKGEAPRDTFFSLKRDGVGQSVGLGCRRLQRQQLVHSARAAGMLPDEKGKTFQVVSMGAVESYCLVVMKSEEQIQILWANFDGEQLQMMRFEALAAIPEKARVAFGKGDGHETEGEFVAELEGRSVRHLWADLMAGTRRCGLSASLSARNGGVKGSEFVADGKAEFDATPGRRWKLATADFDLNRLASRDSLNPRVIDRDFSAVFQKHQEGFDSSTHCRVTRVFDERTGKWRRWDALSRPQMSAVGGVDVPGEAQFENGDLMPPALGGRSGRGDGVRDAATGRGEFVAVLAQGVPVSECLRRVQQVGAAHLALELGGLVGSRNVVRGVANEAVMSALAKESCLEDVFREDVIN